MLTTGKSGKVFENYYRTGETDLLKILVSLLMIQLFIEGFRM